MRPRRVPVVRRYFPNLALSETPPMGSILDSADALDRINAWGMTDGVHTARVVALNPATREPFVATPEGTHVTQMIAFGVDAVDEPEIQVLAPSDGHVFSSPSAVVAVNVTGMRVGPVADDSSDAVFLAVLDPASENPQLTAIENASMLDHMVLPGLACVACA